MSWSGKFCTCFGVPSLVLRIFSMFGPAQRQLLVWDLFRKFRDDAEVLLDGTGEEASDEGPRAAAEDAPEDDAEEAEDLRYELTKLDRDFLRMVRIRSEGG